MSSKEKMIRIIFWRLKNLKIYETYLYGTVEEFVMFTLIYFNRSHDAIALWDGHTRSYDRLRMVATSYRK